VSARRPKALLQPYHEREHISLTRRTAALIRFGEIVERATGVEPATSSLGTITSRETEGKTGTKRAKFLHFPDRREPCSYLIFRQYPARWPEISLKPIVR
jgi:hypothetical protein